MSMAGLQCKRSSGGVAAGEEERAVQKIERLRSENAVVIMSRTSCCMCHVVKRLLCGLGVNSSVCELDEEGEEGGREMEKALVSMVGLNPPVPAVFVGGSLIGGLDSLMSMHISGHLVPMLKQAGALWL